VPPLEVIRSFPAPGEQLCGLAWDGQHIWHSDAGEERIYCFDPQDGTMLRSFGCPSVRTCLAWDGSGLWQVAGRPKRLKCLDPADGYVRRELELGSETACGIEIDGGTFWLTDEEGRIELRSLDDGGVLREVAAIPRIAGITLADGVLWYAVDHLSLLVAVDPETGVERARREVMGIPTGLT
jgi:outer membrane protein assembly factor BamB